MSTSLHIILIVAALGFCLSAQQLQHANNTAAACRKLDPPPPPQHNTAHNITYSERPESVSSTATSTTTMSSRISNDGVSSRGDRLTDDSQARPTRVKTPAAETVLPTNTKVPVALSAAAATKSSDPGFVALVAALGLVTLGMALV
ncbi:hypothetical protein CRV24_008854 [Beauveria bassiana]|uniref:Uncharacterized protein n=1 Tax=Beauveria bassiana (strain ARSEF 2860) TaxID=655819 RepID=J4WJC0_BEAB2|nr:uncharacterized protein BBA_00769 [Beauveria bassiana ARSEF 2860]EJP69900.1 hypothetical protein BBA_00769 [Beauveria bassiana ARSEF 2860]KAF1730784.1 hypothetical protein CRV24_008854 [Beauveria bassiana]KAH8715174.1 hypothetical protein HC256_004024 [Beauveria bassiana]